MVPLQILSITAHHCKVGIFIRNL